MYNLFTALALCLEPVPVAACADLPFACPYAACSNSTGSELSNQLVGQLLGEGTAGGSGFATTSDGEDSPVVDQPDYSRVGMDGANPETDASQEELQQVGHRRLCDAPMWLMVSSRL